ncbi:MAG TPA: hypothetical protein VFD32_13765 [Dehalococcoidia bacterium]|nr:hypothetical protein [Dehalococcoidia bacterium]
MPGPDGSWLALSCRVANGEEKNAVLYSAGGERLAAFHAGDGIRDAQVSPSGEIWIGYFDEGVYSSSSRLGSDGLVCFSSNGTLLYGYNSDPIAPQIRGISDCYPFKVASARETWLFYYSDFRLVRLVDRRVDAWWDAQALAGASAVAVDGERALFAGKYARSHTRMEEGRRRIVIMKDDPEEDWLYLVTLATGAVEPVLPVARGGDGKQYPIAYSHRACLARGTRLFIVGERSLYVVDLRDVI